MWKIASPLVLMLAMDRQHILIKYPQYVHRVTGAGHCLGWKGYRHVRASSPGFLLAICLTLMSSATLRLGWP